MSTSEPTIADALDLLDRAWRIARDVVAAAPTPQQALEWAAAFVKAAEVTQRHAEGLRNSTAADIWRREEFAIAELARQTGLSKQRMSQIIADAKATARKEQP